MAKIKLNWPGGTPDSRSSEWIEAVRYNICYLAKIVKFDPSDDVLFPFGENWHRGLIIRTDMLLSYNSNVMNLLTKYRNHLVKPVAPADIPQFVNPPWTVNTIMDVIGGNELPDPQYNTFDNDLWILRMKQILDLLKWPIIPGAETPDDTWNARVLSWNTYSFACESINSFIARQESHETGPPLNTFWHCDGWYWANKAFARHTDETGDWVIDTDAIISECDENQFCGNPECPSKPSPACWWNQDDKLKEWCPEWSHPTYGTENIDSGVRWHLAGHDPVWYLHGWKGWGRADTHWYTVSTNGTVTMSKPVVHPEKIPAGYNLSIYLQYEENGENKRISLGRFNHVDPSGETEVTEELFNPFSQYESIKLPGNPPKDGSAVIEESMSVSVVFVREYTGDSDA